MYLALPLCVLVAAIGRKKSKMLSDPCVGMLPSSCHASALLAIPCYLEITTASSLVYLDCCLTAGYPIRLGAGAGIVEVLASAFDAVDVDPSDGRFADAEHAM